MTGTAFGSRTRTLDIGMEMCAFCGKQDASALGVCPACANAGDRTLIFLKTIEPRAQSAVAERLRTVLPELDSGSLSEVFQRRQPLIVLPNGHAPSAIATMRQLDVPANAVAEKQWYRALPGGFTVMVASVVLAGTAAGVMAAPMFLWQSWVLAGALLLGAALQLRRPALQFAQSGAMLPQDARVSVASALATIGDSPAREVLLDIARVGEQAFGALGAAFRNATLGDSVADLVGAAGTLAVESMRLERVLDAEANPQIEAALTAHRKLLDDTLRLLTEIARQTIMSPEAAATHARALLKQVRAEQAWRIEGEREATRIAS